MRWRTPDTAAPCARAVALGAILAAALSVVACSPGPATRELAAARAAAQAGDLEAAHRHYEVALSLEPGSDPVRVEIAEVRRKLVDRAVARAGEQGAGGDAAGLRAALATLDGAAAYDPRGERIPRERAPYARRLAEIEEGNAARASQARAALASGRFELAAEHVAAIQATDPAWSELPALEAAYREAHAEALAARVADALAADDLPAARKAFAGLEALDPGRADALRPRLVSSEGAWIRRTVEADLRRGRYYTAYLRLLGAARPEDFADLEARVRRDGAAFYLAQARRRLARKEAARAYLEAVKGLELDGAHPGLFEVHRTARDAQLQALQTYVAIPTFGTPRDRPELGAQFSDALISYLFRILPYGINIVEREKIDLLLQEQERGFSELGGVIDVDLIVSGNVSLMKIERQDSQQEALARVAMGERHEPNPAYEVALRRIDVAGRRGDDEALGQLPPPTIAVPVYETIRYKKGSLTVKGFATVSARIFDTRKTSIVYADEFNARFAASDEYRDSVDAAQIDGDPLELPTDTEIVESLRNELVEKVAALIVEQFDGRHRVYLERARYRLARREVALAMDPLAAGFLYCVKADVPDEDEDFAALRELILDHTERDFLSGDGS